MEMTPRRRLLAALAGCAVDRVPVIVPGGMMAGTLYSIVHEEGLPYPEIHTEAEVMVQYTRYLQTRCGIDNVGVPFCMTVEAEDFGASVDLGSPLEEPRVTGYVADTLDDVIALIPTSCRRHRTVIQAIRELAGGDVPVVGNLTGPISLLTSLLEPTAVYRAMAKDECKVVRAMERVSDHLIAFASEQIDAGADVTVIADPSAAGDILGGHFFGRLVAPSITRLVQSIKNRNVPVILHICGNIVPLVDHLGGIAWDALSVDSIVSLGKLQHYLPGRALMGNVSTHMMATAREEKILRASRKAVEIAAILAPACGLPTTTLPENLRAMVNGSRAAGRSPVRGGTGNV
jgi:[methyl-Co(III) methanol-specific corrinoid protein]:coenzyme M methyltransferase